MREPRYPNYQSLKDTAAEAGREDGATTNDPEATSAQAPAAEYISPEDKIEAARADFAEKLRQRFDDKKINTAERSNLMGRWENDVSRGEPVDKVTARYDGSRPENSARPAQSGAQERPETGAKSNDGDQGAAEQAVTGGKEMTEGMQARLDRLHAAQSNAPKGWDGPSKPNENGQGGRGGGGRGA